MYASLADGFFRQREPSRDDPSSHWRQQWAFRICYYSEAVLVSAGEDELRRSCSMAKILVELLYNNIPPREAYVVVAPRALGVIPGGSGVDL